MTGIFCLFHRLTPPASPIFKILRRLRIVGLAVMVIVFYFWADNIIVSNSNTLKLNLDKHVYQPGETSVITVIRSGLLKGRCSLKCADTSLDAYEEDISRQRYFYTVKPVADTHNEEGFVTVIASHNMAGIFYNPTYVNSKAHFRVLNSAKPGNIQ